MVLILHILYENYDQWIAWQFNRQEQGTGFIQVFRRENCGESVKTFYLSGLYLNDQYEFRNFDVEGSKRFSGKELMEKGLSVEIKDKPGAAIITYQKIENHQ